MRKLKTEVKSIIEQCAMYGNKDRILNPSIGDEVYQCTGKDTFVKVKILEGQYYGAYGVSNFWEYENLETGEIERGYGYFFVRIPRESTEVLLKFMTQNEIRKYYGVPEMPKKEEY